ncbi:hypothetical protein DSY1751 [Desulfitobacterium hafniense Y51]|uniref:Uncharacterized protein n=1 Tax=Desulfitobacterium hafniense (strain Y51) TaxID=138119 RepID=Q24WQ2_DESHY|nr:hypothetical protein DSY1751 [Desulfitobacterium hafniense Y51]
MLFDAPALEQGSHCPFKGGFAQVKNFFDLLGAGLFIEGKYSAVGIHGVDEKLGIHVHLLVREIAGRKVQFSVVPDSNHPSLDPVPPFEI